MNKFYALFLFAIVAGNSNSAWAQQQSMYTMYAYNTLAYNPAYAGSAGAFDLNILHRHQWWGFGPNAPMTQNLTLHSPLPSKNIGLGLNMTFDRIAVSRSLDFFPTFAYRIKFGDHTVGSNGKKTGKGGYISLGLQGGVSNFNADWSQLNLDNPNDPAFQVQRPNVWLPNFGAGIYVHTDKWFVGLSAPFLITNKLRRRTSLEPADLPIAQQYRHYYFTAGYAFELTPDIVFRPTILFKNVGLFVERQQSLRIGAPNEFDIDAAFLFKNKFWVGASFRSAFELRASSYDSVDFWAAVMLGKGHRIGFSFDYTLTRLNPGVQGSYEIMYGFNLIRYEKGFDHPRYF